MFQCFLHGWSSIELPCPLCTKQNTVTTSDVQILSPSSNDEVEQLRKENEKALKEFCEGELQSHKEVYDIRIKLLQSQLNQYREALEKALKECEGNYLAGKVKSIITEALTKQ